MVTLESLEARGLVTRTPDGTRFVATSPTETLGAELVERRERLHRAELALAGLIEAYRVGSMGRGQRELMEIVEGTEAVRRRYVHMQLTARSSIDFFSTGGHRAVGPESTQEARALQRGVRLRGVVDEEFLSQPSGSDNLDAALVEGTCVRTVRAIPLKLIICDGEVAMMPLHGQGTEVNPSLVLRGGPVNVARALFEAVWERARPYTERTWEIEAVDARLMRLLLAGLTDTTAAAQLGLSTRTVQRRIQALMVRAGVSTRLQLGWHARDHRWV
ncbi:helix-turn-helix transcriptional regulator [Streptomyces sp. NPDC055055]